ncbi:MAG: hypothetical protein RLZ44_1221 [Pseudomonadota bacterium]|jgi:PKHD-type hydroxylase
MMICINNVLTKAEALGFRRQLETGAWESGALTAGPVARLAKNNRQLAESHPLAISLGNEILRRLGTHPQFVSAALPHLIHPPRFNRYDVGETYGTHVDGALMRLPGTQMAMRSDLSATLFLTDPADYDGGELQIEGAAGGQSIKLGPGDLVLYPASTLHRVTPVTRGTRICAFFWVQSHVRNESARATLYDLDQAIQGLASRVGAADPHLLSMTHVYHNLLRRWAEA